MSSPSAYASVGFIIAVSPRTPAPAVAISPKPSHRSLRSDMCDLPGAWAESSGQAAAPAARVFNIGSTPLDPRCLRNPYVFLWANSVNLVDAHRLSRDQGSGVAESTRRNRRRSISAEVQPSDASRSAAGLYPT